MFHLEPNYSVFVIYFHYGKYLVEVAFIALNKFIYLNHDVVQIPGEQDTEAVKAGKKTIETIKGVSFVVVLALQVNFIGFVPSPPCST